jgi:hypothetical protein
MEHRSPIPLSNVPRSSAGRSLWLAGRRCLVTDRPETSRSDREKSSRKIARNPALVESASSPARFYLPAALRRFASFNL